MFTSQARTKANGNNDLTKLVSWSNGTVARIAPLDEQIASDDVNWEIQFSQSTSIEKLENREFSFKKISFNYVLSKADFLGRAIGSPLGCNFPKSGFCLYLRSASTSKYFGQLNVSEIVSIILPKFSLRTPIIWRAALSILEAKSFKFLACELEKEIELEWISECVLILLYDEFRFISSKNKDGFGISSLLLILLLSWLKYDLVLYHHYYSS